MGGLCLGIKIQFLTSKCNVILCNFNEMLFKRNAMFDVGILFHGKTCKGFDRTKPNVFLPFHLFYIV